MRSWRAAVLFGARSFRMLAAVSVVSAGLVAVPGRGRACRRRHPARGAARPGRHQRAWPRRTRGSRPRGSCPPGPAVTAWPAPGSGVAATAVAAKPTGPLPAGASPPRLSALLAAPAGGQAAALPLFAARAGGAVRGVRFHLLAHSAAAAAGVRGVVFTAAAAAGPGGRVRSASTTPGSAQAYGGNYGPRSAWPSCRPAC